MKTVSINHKQNRTNYTGLDEGAVPVNVYRKARFIVVHVGEPEFDKVFRNEFRTVKFVDQTTGEVFTNTLFNGHYARLAQTLTEGNVVEIEYLVGDNWIKSIDGERWN